MKNSKFTPRRPKVGTQKAIVLSLLIAAQGRPVGVDTLMREARAAAIHSVVADLRKYGYDIRNRQSKIKQADGRYITASDYWLVSPSEQKGDNA